MLSSKLKKGPSPLICIFAGSPSADVHGAQFMQSMKKLSKTVNFIGLGGPKMQKVGLNESYGDVNTFLDKPLFPYKNFLRVNIEKFVHPLMLPLHYTARKQVKQLEAIGFFKDLLELRPDAFVSLGNEFFTRRLYTKIAELYYNYDVVKPPAIYVNNMLIDQRNQFKEYQDHILYTLPKEPVNWKYFKFPSTYIGVEGIAKAYRFLYQTSEKYLGYVKENSILISHRFHKDIMEELIAKERVRFREKNGISESATVFFIAPGNMQKEVQWSVPLLRKSIETFLKKDVISAVNKENFAVVISAPEDEDDLAMIKQRVNAEKWPCKVVLTSSEDEKYSAMAGSDMGFVLNGEMVYESAAMQLPIIAASCINFLQTYHTLLYNNFNSDINIALEGEAYPELLGQYFPEKIAELFEEWYKNPKLKFRIIESFEKLIPTLLPQVSPSDINASDVKQGEIMKDNIEFTEHYFSNYVAAKTILGSAEKYSELAKKTIPQENIFSVRDSFIRELKWD